MLPEQTISFPVQNAAQLATLHASIAHFRFMLCTPVEGSEISVPDVDDRMSW